MLSTFQANSK